MFIDRINKVTSQYISQNNEDNFIFIRHNIATIVKDLQDERIVNWRATQYLRQKIQNYFFRQEILNLQQAAQKEKITFLVLKGLPLAIDLYPDPNMRPSGDIDILIKPEDLESFVTLCLNLGYSCSASNIAESLQRLFHSNEQHYSALYKQIGDYRLDLEIHVQVFASNIHNNSLIKDETVIEVFQNIQPRDFYGRTIFTMGHLDNFIFLCVHMVKHYFWNVMCYNAKGSYVSYFSFKDLCDVGLFYEKYNMNQKNSDIVKKAILYGVFPEVLFAMSLLQLINPNLYNPFINEDTEDELTKYGSFVSRSIQVLLPQLNCDSLFWSTEKLASKLAHLV